MEQIEEMFFSNSRAQNSFESADARREIAEAVRRAEADYQIRMITQHHHELSFFRF